MIKSDALEKEDNYLRETLISSPKNCLFLHPNSVSRIFIQGALEVIGHTDVHLISMDQFRHFGHLQPYNRPLVVHKDCQLTEHEWGYVNAYRKKWGLV